MDSATFFGALHHAIVLVLTLVFLIVELLVAARRNWKKFVDGKLEPREVRRESFKCIAWTILFYLLTSVGLAMAEAINRLIVMWLHFLMNNARNSFSTIPPMKPAQ